MIVALGFVATGCGGKSKPAPAPAAPEVEAPAVEEEPAAGMVETQE